MSPISSSPGRIRVRSRLSREIAAALLIKLAFLVGLWFLFFRGHADRHSAEVAVQGWFPPAAGTVQSRIP